MSEHDAREKAWREYRESDAHKHHGATKRPFLAGYEAAAKPRTVTTVDELDALPVRSAVRIQQGHIMERYSDGWFTPVIQTPYKPWPIWLPATVLFTPEATR